MRKAKKQAERRYTDAKGKTHLPCPHSDRSGIMVHVVIKDGCCYRAGECLVVECRYGVLQNELENLLSITW